MPETFTFGQWEEKLGVIVPDVTNELWHEVMTEDEFRAIAFKDGKLPIGVNHADRIAFLKANGYEVTRANMIDRDLSTKQPQE